MICCFFLEKTTLSEEGENHFCNLAKVDIFVFYFLQNDTFKRRRKAFFCQNYRTVILFSLEKYKLSEEGENLFCNLTNDDTAAFPLRNQDFGNGRKLFCSNQTVILLVFL